jgi:leucyl/phenylalanyl-tRNA--protein transferase
MSTRQPEQHIDPDFVVTAYRNGYFPMAESHTGPISWYSPDPRAILPLDEFKISRSLRRTVRSGIYEIRINTAFPRVIRACAGRAETWISDEIVRVYTLLHERGDAHSVEAWHNDRLAGGLYGVAIGGAFFGESMFSAETDASKVALVSLVGRLQERGFLLLDTQFVNAHILQFGAREIPRRAYLKLLELALLVETRFAG